MKEKYKRLNKKHKQLSFDCKIMFSTKVLIEAGHLINFTSPILETGGALYVFIQATRTSKAIPSLSYFKNLSIGPASRIYPAAFRSRIKCSTELANGLIQGTEKVLREIRRTAMCIKRTEGMRYWRNSRIPCCQM